VTDSILPTRLVDATRSGRLVVLQASALYGEAIRRIGCGESVVALRENATAEALARRSLHGLACHPQVVARQWGQTTLRRRRRPGSPARQTYNLARVPARWLR